MKEEQDEKTSKPPKSPQDESKSVDVGEGKIIPEEYQKQVHAVIQGQPKHHLNHVRGVLNDAEDDMRKKEMESKPKTFSKDEMPSSGY